MNIGGFSTVQFHDKYKTGYLESFNIFNSVESTEKMIILIFVLSSMTVKASTSLEPQHHWRSEGNSVINSTLDVTLGTRYAWNGF